MEVKTKDKKVKKTKTIALFSSVVVLATAGGYELIKNREPDIDISNKDIITSVEKDRSIDELLEMYNEGQEKQENSNTGIATALTNEDDIVQKLDLIEQYAQVSNQLEKLDLDDVTAASRGLRSLTQDEKTSVANLNLTQLQDKIASYEKQKDVDINDFSKNAIDKNRLAMDLEYAEDLINSELIQNGNEFMEKYGELLIQSIVIDQTGLDLEQCEKLKLTENDKEDIKSKYIVKYYAESTGQQFIVELKDDDVEDIAYYSAYFKELTPDVIEEDLSNYKENVLKAIHVYKKGCLNDYEMVVKNRTDNNTWELKPTQSNSEIKEKVKELSKTK